MCTVGSPLPFDVAGLSHHAYAHEFAHWPVLSRLYLSRSLEQALASLARRGAIFHSHGLWSMPNIIAARVATSQRRPLIMSPRGMLADAALRFSPLKKTIFSAVAQRRALTSATCFHATSTQEYEEIRAFGLTQPVAIIPNGIAVPSPVDVGSLRSGPQRTVLYLGRLHPKKGLEQLLLAWSILADEAPSWHLRIVGPSESDYLEKLKTLSNRLALKRVSFRGEVYGEEREIEYSRANIFVLPTLNENFGMVVAEALARELPVICSKGAPWAGLLEQKCGWWVESDSGSLAAAMRKAFALPDQELKQMGSRGREWMERDFSWHRVACELRDVYQWQLGGVVLPSSIRLA